MVIFQPVSVAMLRAWKLGLSSSSHENATLEPAKELAISASLVYGLCAAGKIRHERHGLGRGTIRIPREALDEYRRSAEAKPKGEVVGLTHITLR